MCYIFSVFSSLKFIFLQAKQITGIYLWFSLFDFLFWSSAEKRILKSTGTWQVANVLLRECW